MTQTTLSLDTARLLLLSVQGLVHPPSHPAAKGDVLDAIRRMGALQIDTIHVVARSPYLTLFSRIGSYDPRWLEELLAEGQLFEYWSHAACFIPIEDYPLYVSRMQKFFRRYYSDEWIAKHQATMEQVMARIHADGAVRSADFERTDGRKGSWWDWKVEKQVLEYLYTVGDLMIARREKFQRVYDLRQRVLPGWDAAPAPSLEEAEDELAVRGVRVLGVAPARWVPDYFRLPKQGMPKRLERLADAGRLVRVSVEGWSEPWYLHPQNLSLLEYAALGEIEPNHTALLSPFDPIVWHRERASALFNFDYVLECYIPEPKRRYGYFVLAVLHNGRLIGRLDAKAHRKDGVFEVRAFYLEPNVPLYEDTAESVAAAIQRCAEWHGTPQVVIRKSDPEAFGKMLAQKIAAFGPGEETGYTAEDESEEVSEIDELTGYDDPASAAAREQAEL